ncbi:MAG: PEP-CTERM sorting domain-containing protein [Coleofasciculus sp. C1-SOL-03]|uniref:PEP-CTERM sorting domain-containing protein n=1 Tax=Coleofasciculus sp. C1-SOL-03 TaxID=3069522 RepID=UPI003300F58D
MHNLGKVLGTAATLLTFNLICSNFAQASTIAVDPSGGGTPVASADAIHGWSFTVNNTVALDELLLFDLNSDGFRGNHDVGVWDTNSTTPLLQGTFSAGTSNPTLASADSRGIWRVLGVPNLQLNPNTTYVIGYYNPADGYDATVASSSVFGPLNITTSSDIVFGEAREALNVASLTRPDDFSSSRNPGWFGPSFTTTSVEPEPVPEPATILGSVTALGMGRLLKKKSVKKNQKDKTKS